MAIVDAIYDLQLIADDAPCVNAGDINHFDIQKITTSLKQGVAFTSRKNSTFNLLYAYIPQKQGLPPHPIGNSDHETAKLDQLFRQKIRTAKVIKNSQNLNTRKYRPTDRMSRMAWFECVDGLMY